MFMRRRGRSRTAAMIRGTASPARQASHGPAPMQEQAQERRSPSSRPRGARAARPHGGRAAAAPATDMVTG